MMRTCGMTIPRAGLAEQGGEQKVEKHKEYRRRKRSLPKRKIRIRRWKRKRSGEEVLLYSLAQLNNIVISVIYICTYNR